VIGFGLGLGFIFAEVLGYILRLGFGLGLGFVFDGRFLLG